MAWMTSTNVPVTADIAPKLAASFSVGHFTEDAAAEGTSVCDKTQARFAN
jgi:hypothetical protein